MKITATTLMLLVLFLPACGSLPLGQEYTQWNLPEGAIARLGKGGARKVQYSPDGARLAVFSSIGTWLYDTTTYREIALLTGHRIAFSPDGTMIASRGGESTVRLWDTKKGELKHTLSGHVGWVNNVAFSPDGKTLASWGEDETVLLWDVKTGEPKQTLDRHADGVYGVSFSPDSKTLTSRSKNSPVRLWDTETGELKGTLTEHETQVVAFSPDGKTLAGWFQDEQVRLWDTVTWEQKRTITGHGFVVRCIVFSPDGSVLASGGHGGIILVWKVDYGEF